MILPQADRRLAVRAAFALHLYAQPRTPFCRCAAFPLKGKQGMVPLPPAPLEMARAQSTAEPCAPLRATKWRGGALWQEPQVTYPKSRPPFGGQGCLCASSLHAASYTLLPLRGISPQGETRNCPAEPCAPLRGRGPRSGAGVYCAENLNEQASLKYSYHIFL